MEKAFKTFLNWKIDLCFVLCLEIFPSVPIYQLFSYRVAHANFEE